MYREILRGIAGVGVFPLLSLLLFVGVFVAVLVRVVRMDGASTRRLAALPLEDVEGAAHTRQEG